MNNSYIYISYFFNFSTKPASEKLSENLPKGLIAKSFHTMVSFRYFDEI